MPDEPTEARIGPSDRQPLAAAARARATDRGGPSSACARTPVSAFETLAKIRRCPAEATFAGSWPARRGRRSRRTRSWRYRSERILRRACIPNTGPLIWDRHQARIVEGLLGKLHPRWRPATEVGVTRPARGWIDVVLHDAREQPRACGRDRVGHPADRAAGPLGKDESRIAAVLGRLARPATRRGSRNC